MAVPSRSERRWHCRFFAQSSDGFAQCKGFLIFTTEPAERNRSVYSLPAADDQHDRYLSEAVFSDFVSNFLVARIKDNPETRSLAFPSDFRRVICRFRSNRCDDDLHRRQPQRQTAGIMLDHDRDKALHRTEDRPVQHDRGMARAILADIDSPEPPRHVEIELNSAALPLAAKRVAEVEFELRSVKRALAW